MNLTILSQIIGFVIALTVHEFAHAFVANKLGDPTAKYAGRLSFNPMKHIDIFGTILLPLSLIILKFPFLFGWAKPVPINPYNLRGKNAEAGVSFAGPFANFLVAVGLAFILRILPDKILASWSEQFFNLFIFIIAINLTFGIFNLIPIPPLDGSKILINFLPRSFKNVEGFLEKYGLFILMFFVLFGGGFIFGAVSFLLDFLLGGLLS